MGRSECLSYEHAWLSLHAIVLPSFSHQYGTGTWRALRFLCVPHISYRADAQAFSFLTADLALPDEPPVRHVLVGSSTFGLAAAACNGLHWINIRLSITIA